MKKKKEEADLAGSDSEGFESMYGDSQCMSEFNSDGEEVDVVPEGMQID